MNWINANFYVVKIDLISLFIWASSLLCLVFDN